MLSNEEIKKLLFWKRLFEYVGCKGAVLVLTKRNEDILSNIVKYIPFVMKNNMYLCYYIAETTADFTYRRHLIRNKRKARCSQFAS